VLSPTATRRLTIVAAPLIYSVILPVALIDVWMTTYQAVCFRVYGVPRVRRSDFMVIDRHRLPYLAVLDKLNCVYCGYANGVIAYVREIVSRTEEYWCPMAGSCATAMLRVTAAAGGASAAMRKAAVPGAGDPARLILGRGETAHTAQLLLGGGCRNPRCP
jgi:hypothetical protein